MKCPSCDGQGEYLVDAFSGNTGHFETLRQCDSCEGTGVVWDDDSDEGEEE